jgi:hypothetical protein
MDGLTMHDLAADVAGVIESESKGSVIVVGHAFGNFVARQAIDGPSDMSLPEAKRLEYLRIATDRRHELVTTSGTHGSHSFTLSG